MIKEIPVGNGFYLSESLPVSQQFCRNMYPNYPETTAISNSQLFPCPGLVEVADAGENQINRGSELLSDKPYFVCGQALYRLEPDLTLANLGEISGAGRVSMAENGTQLCIVVPGTGFGYIYDEQNGLQQITDQDFTANGNAEIVVFIDGYFVFTTNTKKFFCSAINNGLDYNALDFGTAEADPDAIRSAHVYKNQLYILGSETIEVFQNVGGVDFPFQRITGYVIPKGIAAPFSVADFDGSFVFIGQGVNESPKIYMFTGSGVSPISTTAIDTILQQEKDIKDAFVWTYTFRGATFCGFSFASSTIVFDSKASALSGKKIWHERLSQNLQEKSRWRANSIITAYNKLLVGDSEGGLIGEIDNDTATEYGNFIDRFFSIQTLENNSQPITFNYVELVLESGLGLNDQKDPQVRLGYSDNSKVTRLKGMRGAGKQGEYGRKVRWNQLGRTNRWRTFFFRMTDPVRFVVLKVVLSLDG